MPEIHYGRGHVYSIQYHRVWCVKYRRTNTKVYSKSEKSLGGKREYLGIKIIDFDSIQIKNKKF